MLNAILYYRFAYLLGVAIGVLFIFYENLAWKYAGMRRNFVK